MKRVKIIVLCLLFVAAAACSSSGDKNTTADTSTPPQEDTATSDTTTVDTITTPDTGAPTLCQPRSAVTPTASFFSDISTNSGIRAGNYDPNPPIAVPINDHSRLGFVDIDGDGWDDIVAHSLFPNPVNAEIPFEHLVFRNNGDGTFEDVSDASGL